MLLPPLLQFPILAPLIPRQQKALAAVELIRDTTTQLIRKCKEMVDDEEMAAAAAAADAGEDYLNQGKWGRRYVETRRRCVCLGSIDPLLLLAHSRSSRSRGGLLPPKEVGIAIGLLLCDQGRPVVLVSNIPCSSLEGYRHRDWP